MKTANQLSAEVTVHPQPYPNRNKQESISIFIMHLFHAQVYGMGNKNELWIVQVLSENYTCFLKCYSIAIKI